MACLITCFKSFVEVVNTLGSKFTHIAVAKPLFLREY